MEENLKILLCEDDENLGMLLREYLQAKGFEAVLCPDGEVGYREFQKAKFDICVLDVMMPKKDGFALAQDIRQQNAEMPIIFLTAKVLKEDILEGNPAQGKGQEEPREYSIPYRPLHFRHTEAAAHNRREADQAHNEGERAAGSAVCSFQ